MKRKNKIILIIVLLSCVLCFSITSYARYSFSNVWNYYLESQKFFFTSDYLSSNQKNADTLWDGGSVSFNLKNFSNNDLISDKDISYQVTCEVIDGEEDCTLNGTQYSTVRGVLSRSARCINEIDEEDVSSMNKTECEVAGYTWEKSTVTNNLYFDVTSAEEISNVDVRITATATAPFQKTITGVFHLVKTPSLTGEINHSVNHLDQYDELIITNSYSTNKTVEVSFDTSKRVVDVTNEMTITDSDANDYVSSFEIQVNALSSKTIIFYQKDNLSDFTDISVQESQAS